MTGARFMKHLMFPEHEDVPDAYDWSVVEIVSPQIGLPEGRIVGVVSWLTERQADALAASLNDICGHQWSENHPDWLAEAKEVRQQRYAKYPLKWSSEST